MIHQISPPQNPDTEIRRITCYTPDIRRKIFFSSVLPPPNFRFRVPKILTLARQKSCQRSEEFGMRPLSQWLGPTISFSPVPRPLYLSGFRPTISAPMPTISVAIGQLSQCLGQLSQLQRHLSQCQNQKANNISEKDPGPASLRQSLQPAWRNSSMLSQNFVAETV